MSVKDERPWIKLSIDYLDNPKIDGLSDQAILLHLALMLRAAQQRSGGKVSARVAEQRGKAVLKELTDGKLLVKEDPKTYRIHDYEKHQTVHELSKKRAISGARGGHMKNHKNKGIFATDCTYCQEDQTETQSPQVIPEEPPF